MKKILYSILFCLLLSLCLNVNVKATENIAATEDTVTEDIISVTSEDTIGTIPENTIDTIPEEDNNIAEGFCGDDAYWYLYENGFLHITGTGYIYKYGGPKKFPWYKYKDDITSIYVDEGILNIPQYAFDGYSNLNLITFAKDSKLQTIGEYAFNESGITEISIPANVNTMEESCFEFSQNLKRVTFLGEKLTEIPYCAFYGTSLESVTIPKSVNKIGEYAFCCCKNLTDVQFEKGSELQTLESMCFAETSIKVFTVPKGVTEINDFLSNTLIEEIYFEDGSLCTAIPEKWFYWELSLKKVKMPDSLMNIGKEAFKYCNNLKEVDFSRCYNLQKIGREAFFSCYSLEKAILPDSVNLIYELAFADCRNLSEINIPANLEVIDKSSFLNCTNLTEVDIPYNVKVIEEHAFENCFNLININISNENIVIKNNAFLDCKNLEVSEGLYNRNKEAFIGCNIITNNNDNTNNTNEDNQNNNNNNNSNNNTNNNINNKIPGTYDSNTILIYIALLLMSSISFKRIKA